MEVIHDRRPLLDFVTKYWQFLALHDVSGIAAGVAFLVQSKSEPLTQCYTLQRSWSLGVLELGNRDICSFSASKLGVKYP